MQMQSKYSATECVEKKPDVSIALRFGIIALYPIYYLYTMWDFRFITLHGYHIQYKLIAVQYKLSHSMIYE